MGVYVSVLSEIHNRLNTALGSGKKLSDVSALYVTNTPDNITKDAYPCIYISDYGFNEGESSFTAHVGSVEIEEPVVIKIRKVHDDNTTNPFFGESDDVLYLAEKAMNVIYEDTSENYEDSFGGLVQGLHLEKTPAVMADTNISEVEVHVYFSVCNVNIGAR